VPRFQFCGIVWLKGARLHVPTTNAQYGVPSAAKAVPRILCEDRRSHRYSLYPGVSEVSAVCKLIRVEILLFEYHSPETVLILRALSTFESLYLSRSSTRLNEAVAQATRTSTSPGLNEGVNIARVVVNELDSARFDPLLVRSIAKGAVSSLDGLVGRVENLVCTLSRKVEE
jgi:hypothetical protein